MKTRLLIIAILLLILTVLFSRNDERITDTLLGVINPIKQNYKKFTQSIEDKSQNYIFQAKSIKKLNHENRVLRKRLLEQMHYVEEVKNIYDILPKLTHLPIENVVITETISYVKLNTFSQILLTKADGLVQNKLYGLIQNHVAAGIAIVHNNQLFGYLTSDQKCRFAVFVGKTKAPGIAMGIEKNEMLVKFIPKWHDIKEGDKVVTSGLDNIFFSDIPVGIVTKLEIQSSYTVAHIKTYSDIFHPKTFFLISDARATLTEDFNNSTVTLAAHCPQIENSIDSNISKLINGPSEYNNSMQVISSIPSRIDQTQSNVIEPEIVSTEILHLPKVPIIKKRVHKKRKIRKKRRVKRKVKRKPRRKIKRRPKRKIKHKRKATTLDLF